jgi:hypothetical protein
MRFGDIGQIVVVAISAASAMSIERIPPQGHLCLSDVLEKPSQFIMRLFMLPMLAVAAICQPVKAGAPIEFDEAPAQRWIRRRVAQLRDGLFNIERCLLMCGAKYQGYPLSSCGFPACIIAASYRIGNGGCVRRSLLARSALAVQTRRGNDAVDRARPHDEVDIARLAHLA